ncbi:OLC1v1005593C1 [Oldenlandia corymbosa var. corymbosa]|uniref:OLC1v1005593C1 n=1 Tax=Oldenlandia corymbosa var. corymbosa TaxID=529605 RepID=A0AAV1DHN4_OLDCO|nr:OLC1v1005593C1 [Oldenlandia corymbosa var. corymbosa]
MLLRRLLTPKQTYQVSYLQASTLKQISNLTGNIDNRLSPSIERVFSDFLDVAPNGRIKLVTALTLPFFEHASSATKDPYSLSKFSAVAANLAIVVEVINLTASILNLYFARKNRHGHSHHVHSGEGGLDGVMDCVKDCVQDALEDE